MPDAPPSWEWEAYSDAHITGHLVDDAGPYKLLNGLAGHWPGRPQVSAPAIVVRESWVLEQPTGMESTDEANYHGGSTFEELSALISCGLGIRCRAAGIVRRWGLEDDPLGRPIRLEHQAPYLPEPGPLGSVLPRLGRTVGLSDLAELLRAYRSMSGDAARAVARAARMYQEGVWVADDAPHLAWLFLVSAAEVAAGYWNGDMGPRADWLREAMPTLAERVEAYGPEHMTEVADELAPLIGSTRRFVEWMELFAPPPPEVRPPEWGQVPWGELRRMFQTIYRYRSRALHAGTPFPEPMCESPRNPHEDGVPMERPFADATRAGDAVWRREDTPMLLATFEYIVRGALQKWWLSLGSPAHPAVRSCG